MDFIALAQQCAPAIDAFDLAAIVEVQSRFDPYVIRTNSGRVLKIQPKTLDDAVKAATDLATSGEDVELGLAGISLDVLNQTGKGIKDAFVPCQNLQMAATLLTEYQDKAGNREDTLALFYGRGDIQAGRLAGYSKVIDAVSVKLADRINGIQIKPGTIKDLPRREWTEDAVALSDDKPSDGTLVHMELKPAKNRQAESWDVFAQSKKSAIIFFMEK